MCRVFRFDSFWLTSQCLLDRVVVHTEDLDHLTKLRVKLTVNWQSICIPMTESQPAPSRFARFCFEPSCLPLPKTQEFDPFRGGTEHTARGLSPGLRPVA